MRTNSDLIESLTKSRTFQSYARTWRNATGMPLRLAAAGETSALGTAPLCSLVTRREAGCAACREFRDHLVQSAGRTSKVRACSFGLSEIAVPVSLDGRLIGHLLTGQVFSEAPSEDGLARLRTHLAEIGVPAGDSRLREAYFATPFLARRNQKGMAQLLTLFAEHLGALAARMDHSAAEPPLLLRAKDYLAHHLDEETSLEQLAREISTSRFYICRLFRRHTGMTFTEYRARCRFERARKLLEDPNRRIIDVAFDAGFQSLTHFNRVFHRMAGESPSEFRARLESPHL